MGPKVYYGPVGLLAVWLSVLKGPGMGLEELLSEGPGMAVWLPVPKEPGFQSLGGLNNFTIQ